MEDCTVQPTPLFSRRGLIQLIIPLVIEQLLAMTIGMADTMMVTRAGEAAVSGVALVDSINLLLIQVLSALATGGAVIASQYLGRRDNDTACKAAKQLLYLSTGIALLLTLLALAFRPQILTLIFGHVDADVMDSALVYFLLTACSFPFLAMYNTGAALFRSMGNSKVSMFTSLVMNIANIGGNFYLVYICGWGAKGVGASTLFSRGLGALVMLALICQKRHPVHIQQLFRPERQGGLVRRILQVGIPAGLENGMFQVGKLTLQRLISSFGTSVMAADAISNSVASIVNVPGTSMGLALITVVGQCMGARDPDQAVSYTKRLMTATYLAMGTLSLALLGGAGFMVGFFNLTHQAALLAARILRFTALFQLTLWPLSFSLPNALRAAGDAKFTMVVSMCSMWVFRIGSAYLMARFWDIGLLAVWFAMFLDWFVRAIVFTVRFARGRWKQIRLI